MGISVSGLTPGTIASKSWGGQFDSRDPKQVAQLADDATFMREIEAVLTESLRAGGGSTDHNAILNALINGDIAALTPQERAEILGSAQQSATIIRGGYGGKVGFTGHETTDLIAKYMNNQGYTGPGANQVLLTVPVAGGGTANITRGQVLDDEGFGALVNKVIGSATDSTGANIRGGAKGMFWRDGGRDPFSDMSKWSESERVAYLQKAAELAKDGDLSPADGGVLALLAQHNTSGGDDEPSVKLSNGKTISNDDIMEDLTFKKTLTEMSSGVGSWRKAESAGLGDLIKSADYGQLSYAERVSLLNLLSDAGLDHSATGDAKRAKIATTMQAYLVPSPTIELSTTASSLILTVDDGPAGRSLANGTFVSEAQLSSSTGFDGLIQRTLRHSGVDLTPGENSGGDNRYTILGLLTMDTSKLDTPAKRFEVLDMISRAASDKTISQAELRNIEKTVDRLSNRPSIWV